MTSDLRKSSLAAFGALIQERGGRRLLQRSRRQMAVSLDEGSRTSGEKYANDVNDLELCV